MLLLQRQIAKVVTFMVKDAFYLHYIHNMQTFKLQNLMLLKSHTVFATIKIADQFLVQVRKVNELFLQNINKN